MQKSVVERVQQHVTRFWQQHAKEPWADELQQGICVAVSGGVDSMVLLSSLSVWCQQNQIPLTALHVDHGLRPTSNEDAALVESACRANGIACQVQSISLQTIQPSHRLGIEADARALRYQSLVDQTKRLKRRIIVLGHHADDQVETVIWRLLRGTSQTGLAGIRPVREDSGMVFVRPLLGLPKSDLEAYATAAKLPIARDESNDDMLYVRNAIRQQVVPTLKAIQPDLLERVRVMTEILQEEDAWLSELAHTVVSEAVRFEGSTCWVQLSVFSLQARPLQRRVIQILWYCFSSAPVAFVHVEAVLNLCASTLPSGHLDLPDGIVVERENDYVRMGRDGAHAVEWTPVEWTLSNADHLVLNTQEGRWTFTCEAYDRMPDFSVMTHWQLCLPSDVRSLWVRCSKTGDRVGRFGSNGTTKLHDVYIDAKVPRRFRKSRPVFTHLGQVLWLPGIARGRGELVREKESVWLITAQPPQTHSFLFHGCDHTPDG